MKNRVSKRKELKVEIIAFRVTPSFKLALEQAAKEEKRELPDFIRLKLEEIIA